MKITKLLKVNGNPEVNAVLLNDEGEEYPVFLESLHNTVLFPVMLESGYELAALPYEFLKDGVSIWTLQQEAVSYADNVLETMYSMLGVKVPHEEIKSKMSEKVLRTLATPPTNYTVHTREQFLEYLERIDKLRVADDFKPLNYFVAPDALFTTNEFRSVANSKWVSIIENRREFSHTRMQKLYDWLVSMGLLNESSTAIDLVDAYFAWGVDGIKFQGLNKHRENLGYIIDTLDKEIPAERYTAGLIDSYGNRLTAESDRGTLWTPAIDSTLLAERVQRIPSGFAEPIQYVSPTTMTTVVIECLDHTIKYTKDKLIMFGRTCRTLTLTSIIEATTSDQLECILPAFKEEFYTKSYIKAIARMLYEKRASHSDLSSYRALILSGCGPFSALKYFMLVDNANRTDMKAGDEELVQVFDSDIYDYLYTGECRNESVHQYLDDIVKGNANIDNVARGREDEAAVNTQGIEFTLTAIHKVLGFALNDIYEKVASITDDMEELVFNNGSVAVKVDCSRLTSIENGFKRDVNQYNISCSNQCTAFCYVTNVAREVGVVGANRHVAVEFYIVDKTKKFVKDILDEIKDAYVDKCVYADLKPGLRERLLEMKEIFSMSRYFECVHDGGYTYPTLLGGDKVMIGSEKQVAMARHVETRIENTTKLTEFAVGGNSASTLAFNIYCVNAIMTPEAVIPRAKETIIHEAPFYALWNDYASENPDMYYKLIELGVLKPGFESWQGRYLGQMFASRSMDELYSSEDSLVTYADACAAYIDGFPYDEEFTACPHPIELMYPGLFGETDDAAPTPASEPREGAPVVRIGNYRDITHDDYLHLFKSNELETAEDQYIKRFSGHSAEGYYCEPNLNNLYPESGKALLIQTGSEMIYKVDTQEAVNFRNIHLLAQEGYPVLNTYGRVWLLSDSTGKLWEVRV